jgi:protease PrsW
MPMTEHAPTLAIALLMAVIYLGVVRLVDMNEKEPLWAVAMLFVLGGLGACALGLGVNLAVLELRVVPAAMAKELARFLAIGAGVGVLTWVAVRRGYSEINGLMDGVVYGAAGGFGYSIGEGLIRALAVGPISTALGLGATPLSVSGIASLGLVGLADGVFGALIGIGFAAALHTRSPVQRALFPLAAYVAAVSAHVSYELLGRGNALGGSEGLVRRWLALLLPVLVVVLVMTVALAQEKRAIRDELATEADTRIVTPDELALLRSTLAREALYLRTLLRGHFGRWASLRGLHNRQVQLALAKRQAAAAGLGIAGSSSSEVQQLRIAIVELKRAIDSPSSAEPAARVEPPAAEPARDEKPQPEASQDAAEPARDEKPQPEASQDAEPSTKSGDE